MVDDGDQPVRSVGAEADEGELQQRPALEVELAVQGAVEPVECHLLGRRCQRRQVHAGERRTVEALGDVDPVPAVLLGEADPQ